MNLVFQPPLARQDDPALETLLSVIIVSWNSQKQLDKCLQSLDSLGLSSIETIVVDSNSEDGTVTFLKHLQNSEIAARIGLTVLYDQTNVGWAKGNEQALTLAKGKWFLLCNPDIEFTQEFNGMLQYGETHDFRVVAAQLIKPDGSVQRCLRKITFTRLFFAFSILGEFLDAGISRRFIWKDFHYGSIRFDKPVLVDHPSASFIMIRRDLVSELGYLIATEFPLYFGDSDLFQRLQNDNIPIVFLPTVRIIHEMGYSTRKLPDATRAFRWTQSMKRYAKRWKLHPRLLTLLLFLDALVSPFLTHSQLVKLPDRSGIRVSAFKIKGLVRA